jgi:hypothetical protein
VSEFNLALCREEEKRRKKEIAKMMPKAKISRR